MEQTETETVVTAEFPAGESSPWKVPRRLRERLSEGRSPLSSVEEIEAKLRDADIRRQKFHEWLSSKARPKVRSPSWSSQEEDLGRRLEAKLYAAEQKRLSLLQRAQTRLARLDELRQAAKNDVVQRSEREREELGTKVMSKIQQAEANRMVILKAHLQRRAEAQERKSQSMMKKVHRENKYKECVQKAIFQKRVAAERKRLSFLEAEKTRAGAKVTRAYRVASSVYLQRETHRRKLREEMEARLSRAKWQRAEYLKQKRNSICSGNVACTKMRRNGDSLSRKLARCWKQFARSKKTTYALVKAYEAFGINREHVKNMPFELLATRIGSPATLESVKLLLERLETRFFLSRSSSSSATENIDHLLKRVSSPTKKSKPNKEPNKMPRYPVRVALCSYMIISHPDAVFSGRGEREIELTEKAAAFLQEFELLTNIILKGSESLTLTSMDTVERVTFRRQLVAFDKAWQAYLYSFVAWKVKDAKLLEEDLVRAACQMELSMMHKCKLSREGERNELNHDMRAIQMQVIEDQQLLRDKVKHLSGSAGVDRMEAALSKTRSKYFERKERGSSSSTPISRIFLQSMPVNRTSDSSTVFLNSTEQYRVSHSTKSSRVVRSLFKEDKLKPQENEVLVNEMLHRLNGDKSEVNLTEEGKIKEKVKKMMEKAFWDGVTESLLKEEPDYGMLINLVKEVKDELSGMSPKSWKDEINGCIDLDILSQMLDSRGDDDLSYLWEVMEYALGVLVKLSATAKENEMKKSHEKFLSELAVLVSQSTDKRNATLTAVVRGLRFVLEQIRDLKEEISRARIEMLEPIVRGSAGIEYLQKAFGERYGPPSEAPMALPLTSRWISSFAQDCSVEWEQHLSLISPFSAQSQALPPSSSIRSGGRLPGLRDSPKSLPSSSSLNSDVPPECKGDKLDLMLRLGLLRLASKIEGLSEETTPETFELNWLRLRNAQSHVQNTIVICASLLVLRQTLISQSPGDMAAVEPTISLTATKLSHLIDHNPDVALPEILSLLTSSLPQPQQNLPLTTQLMAQMLSKSLQAHDPIFAKVSSAVHVATRTLVFGGAAATAAATAALQRVGAAALLGRLVAVAESLATMAVTSGKVHGPWYATLVRE